eukprot:NODE_95_length_2580_cov_118.656262_g89_i0.p1 GENE.NODE_95_length_2580_cov_118.656262_g89_i0~~NODE_95_length_2580_cov_118.656262_g89_i0.p1  ORF type:complete len:740 (+),score=227.29 NODE_95_length_2580_cov_118.656262_g89_i0:155-2374(+)
MVWCGIQTAPLDLPCMGCVVWPDRKQNQYTDKLIDGKKELEFQTELSVTREEKKAVLVKLKCTGQQKAEFNKETVMFFCTKFREGMSDLPERVAIGPNYYNLSQPLAVPQHSCNLFPGLDTTIYITQSGPILSADMTYKHIRTDTVWDHIRMIMGRERDQKKARDLVRNTFANTIALLSYGDPKKSFHINDVCFDLTPASTFVRRKRDKDRNVVERTITFAQYFKEQYGLEQLDMNQPLLMSESRRERTENSKIKISYFIPSFCHLTGATEDMKRDTYRARDLIRLTAMPPGARLEGIANSLQSMLGSPNFAKHLQPWGLSVSNKFLQVGARRLPTPLLRNGSQNVFVNDARESWDVKFQWPMLRSTTALQNVWAVVSCSPQDTSEFLNQMGRVARDLNIPSGPPKIYTTNGITNKHYAEVINNKVIPDGPGFVVVVVPRNSTEPYLSTKRLLSCTHGIPSQFVTIQNIQKDPLLKATKVLVQMNAKSGGAPWSVAMQIPAPTMFVGLDVHHGGDMFHESGSVAAFVASVDKDVTKFYSKTFVVKEKQQILEPVRGEPGLTQLLGEAIERFKKETGGPPVNIVVYRDGGSEGELQTLLNSEVKQIVAAAKEAAVAFLVVLKKIRTRFFSLRPGEVANPPPGTVVDSAVVSNYLPEFYICCQSVNQGSATPTKYQKIFDTTNLNGDQLQAFTYALSHVYYNWPGTIRVPCVMKYASTLAKLVGTLKDPPSNKLAPFLHYL